MKLAVGYMTAPRPDNVNYLSQALDSFFREFKGIKPHVFAEPGIEGFSGQSKCHVHRNQEQKGHVQNWLDSVEYLAAHEPEAQWIMMLEDDGIWTMNSGIILWDFIWTRQRRHDHLDIGFASPYCSQVNNHGDCCWKKARMGKIGWCGALSICMPRESAIAIARWPEFMKYATNEAGKIRHLDYPIGQVCDDIGKAIYTHNPSLIAHIGKKSTLLSNDSFLQYHPARQSNANPR